MLQSDGSYQQRAAGRPLPALPALLWQGQRPSARVHRQEDEREAACSEKDGHQDCEGSEGSVVVLGGVWGGRREWVWGESTKLNIKPLSNHDSHMLLTIKKSVFYFIRVFTATSNIFLISV